MLGRRAAALILLLLLPVGCTGSSGATGPSGGSGAATGAPESPLATASKLPETASATPSSSQDDEPTPVSCGVSGKQIRLFTRDWQRVVDAVGREDQAKYTSALVARMTQLTKAAGQCPGSDELTSLNRLAKQIDAAAEAGEADLDAINTFRQVGNDWLEELGYRRLLLS